MIEGLYSSFKNVIYYKKAKLDLDYTGITVINGLNYNANPPSENGAGKSLLVCGPINVIFDSHPVIKDKTAKTKKQLFGKNSRMAFAWKYNGVVYKAIKFSKEGKIEYKILENGKDREVRTKTIANKEVFKEIFPLTEEEAYTYVYLDGRRDYPMHMGSSAVRNEYITKLFHFNVFDRIKKITSDKLKEIDIYSSKMEVKEEDLRREKQNLLPKSVRLKKIRRKKELKNLLSELRKESDDLYEKVSIARVQSSRKENRIKIESLLSQLELAHKGWSKEQLNILLESCKLQLISLQKKLKKQNRYEEYLIELRDYKESISSLSSHLEKLGINKSFEKISTISSSLSKREGTLESKINKLVEEIESIELIKAPEPSEKAKTFHRKLIKSFPDALTTLSERITKFKQVVLDTVDKIEYLESHIHNANARCDYCDSTLSTDKAAEKLSQLKKLKTEAEEKLLKYKKLRSREEKFLESQKAYEEYSEARGRKKSLLAEKEKLHIKLKKVSSKVEKYQQAVNLHTKISKISKPVKQSKIEIDKKLEQKIEGYEALVSYLNSYIPTCGEETEELDYQSLNSRYKKVQEKLSDVQSKLPRLKMVLENHKETRKRIKTITRDISRWKEQTLDKDTYEYIHDSMKPLKSLAVARVCKQLQDKMNSYSNLLFSEPMNFDIRVDSNNFEIIVTRNPGKEEITSDARFLSGAEAKCFNLLVSFCILLLTPDHRRTNFIVLDEFDANMGETNRMLFINQFIPMLSTIVPHIIIVTPNHDEYPSARKFIATKKGAETKLVEVGV